ncbi:MAG: hypothetical protein GY757_55665, partial [bacterium]|nr:hypothetical protein [bacterium]
FIVKRSQEIKNNLRWRSGVVLENKSLDSTAVVKVDERDKKILILVSGTMKRDRFAVLRHTFKEINGSFEKLDVDEMVPLPGNTNAAVPYSELTGYELEGKDEFFSGKLRQSFSIKHLLNGIVSEVERKEEYMKLPKSDGDIYLNFQQNQLNLQNQENKHVVVQKVDVKQETNVNIDIDINFELPAMQDCFEELKDIMLEQNPLLQKKLQSIEDAINSIHPNSNKEQMTGPVNKLFRFLKNLGDEKSNYRKAIDGAEKGVEFAQNLANGYNNIAKLIGMPSIPELLL